MASPKVGATIEIGFPVMTALADKIRLFTASGLFDEVWYVERYPDVLRSRLSPAEHFVRIGQHIGRRPNEEQDGADAARFLAACRNDDTAETYLDDALRSKVFASHLFNADWYRARFAIDLPKDADVLADYLRRSAGNPLIDPGPSFSTAYYAQQIPDTGDTPPLVHACMQGFSDGRPAFDPQKVDSFLTEARDVSCTSINDLLDPSKPVRIVCWKDGNFFFGEIAQYLRTYLVDMGFETTCDSDLPRSSTAEDNIIVVAPHEFCVHGPGKTWSEKRLAQTIYLNTEQWHTTWFSLAYGFMMLSNKAIDINPASASGLQALGLRTAFVAIVPKTGSPFSLKNTPISEVFAKARYVHELTYPEGLAERPYDVLFVGASNARREAALASLAMVLADHVAFVHCPRFSGPVRPGDPDMMSTSDIVQLARNSKVLLNIHQGESRYFEWHRLFLFGILEGCVVLTEPCIPNPFVEPGRDFVECTLNEMPQRLRWLLETADGQAEMRRIRANCDRLRKGATDWKRFAA